MIATVIEVLGMKSFGPVLTNKIKNKLTYFHNGWKTRNQKLRVCRAFCEFKLVGVF